MLRCEKARTFAEEDAELEDGEVVHEGEVLLLEAEVVEAAEEGVAEVGVLQLVVGDLLQAWKSTERC